MLVSLLPQLIQYLPVFIAAWQHIKAQSGKTNSEILADAEATLDANSKKLIEDLIRLGVLGEDPTPAKPLKAARAVDAPAFTYVDGKVTSVGEPAWSYDLKERFRSQLEAQPQYKGLTDTDLISGVALGAYYVANMATGEADQDYRAKLGIMPTVPGQLPQPTAFADWLEQGEPRNRQVIWNDAAGWFAA